MVEVNMRALLIKKYIPQLFNMSYEDWMKKYEGWTVRVMTVKNHPRGTFYNINEELKVIDCYILTNKEETKFFQYTVNKELFA